eukprot:1318580-Pleurochrysis_carterae.AAC.2
MHRAPPCPPTRAQGRCTRSRPRQTRRRPPPAAASRRPTSLPARCQCAQTPRCPIACCNA